MVIVRYPNGITLTYYTVNFVRYQAWGWELLTRESGQWVATIQATDGVTVEVEAPCAVTGDALRQFASRPTTDAELRQKLEAAEARADRLATVIRQALDPPAVLGLHVDEPDYVLCEIRHTLQTALDAEVPR